MGGPVVFREEDAQRIAAVVRRVEKMPGGDSIIRRRNHGRGAAGDSILLAKATARTAARTYTVDLYSGWDGSDYSLPEAKLVVEDATMKTPTLDDTLEADRIPVDGTGILRVRQETFTEDDGEGGYVENTYWVPVERVGLL